MTRYNKMFGFSKKYFFLQGLACLTRTNETRHIEWH